MCAYNPRGLTSAAIWLEHCAWGIMATESAAFIARDPKIQPNSVDRRSSSRSAAFFNSLDLAPGCFFLGRRGTGQAQLEYFARAFPDFDGTAVPDALGMRARRVVIGEFEIGSRIDASIGSEPIEAVMEHEASLIAVAAGARVLCKTSECLSGEGGW